MGLALGSAVLPTPTPAVGVVPSAQVVAHLNRLKSHGSSEIDRRLTGLQSAIDKLALSSELSDGDMKTMKALLDGEIKRLSTIKDQLSKETDLAAARVDVQAIVNEYPVYGLVLPKARLMTEADRFEAAGKQLQQVANKLSAKISAAKTQGKETATLEKQLATLKVTLAQAKPNYDGLPARILKLQTADYPASYKGLTGYRDSLSATRTQFKSAHDTISLMIVGLKNLKAATPTPSPSASALPAGASPTATPAAH
jgi:DNA repair exonuclease SbcCD ATPase subunit